MTLSSGAILRTLGILVLVTAPVVVVACSDETTPAPPASDAGAGADSSSTSDTGTTPADGSIDVDGCGRLCMAAGFPGGKQTDFGNGLVECQCTGSGGEVTKTACEAYCSPFGVSAAKALLSSEEGQPADKCACDGT